MATRERDAGVHGALETERLILERWDDAHFERFARFMQNQDVIRYIRAEPLDVGRAREQHEHSLAEWEALGFGKRAIVEAETGAWLGFAELSLVGPGKGSRDDDVELGYFIEPARWGEGIATEAARALRDEAFGRCGLPELIGRCRVENIASQRVLAKVGFQMLRLFELADGIEVEIHRLQRDGWAAVPSRRGSAQHDGHATGAEYRETG
jgi:RimJ/RimL family protein N-acetyltransferase